MEVLVRSGEAVLFNGNDLAKAGFGGRGGFSADLPPNGDLPPMSPILGDLALESSDSAAPWRSFVVTEAGIDGQVLESATESGADGSGSNVANAGYRFIRRAAGEEVNRHGEAGIAQIANRDIRDYSILHVRAQVKVNFQKPVRRWLRRDRIPDHAQNLLRRQRRTGPNLVPRLLPSERRRLFRGGRQSSAEGRVGNLRQSQPSAGNQSRAGVHSPRGRSWAQAGSSIRG